jgi:hypothetical protein
METCKSKLAWLRAFLFSMHMRTTFANSQLKYSLQEKGFQKNLFILD